MSLSIRMRAASLIAALTLISTVPVSAAPDGTTTTLEITEGLSAIYYANQALVTNLHSKGARAQAESHYRRVDFFDLDSSGTPKYKIIPAVSDSRVAAAAKPLTLDDLRSFILEDVANDPSLKLTSIPDSIDTKKPGLVKRNAFEIVRSCWNSFVTVSSSTSSASNKDSQSDGAPAGANPADQKPKPNDAKPKPDDAKPKPAAFRKGRLPNDTGPVSFARYEVQIADSQIPAAALPPTTAPTSPPIENVAGGASVDCLQPLYATGFQNHPDYKDLIDLLNIDVLDVSNAFKSAPSLPQQISNLEVGGNVEENRERTGVLAILSVLFLNLFDPAKNPVHFHNVEIVDAKGNVMFPKPGALRAAAEDAAAQKAGLTDVASLGTSFAQGCLVGGKESLSSCQSSISSIVTQLSSTVSQHDVCAFEQLAFIPSYSRITPQFGKASSDPKAPLDYGTLSYGSPPGC